MHPIAERELSKEEQDIARKIVKYSMQNWNPTAEEEIELSKNLNLDIEVIRRVLDRMAYVSEIVCTEDPKYSSLKS